MLFEFISDEQVARSGRFPEEPSVAELEQFIRLESAALDTGADKRSPATRLGWAPQWGTVRMLGVFLTEALPRAVGPRITQRRHRRAPLIDHNIVIHYQGQLDAARRVRTIIDLHPYVKTRVFVS
ncbi:DUF4158 domain-containing protein [Nonomuraea sp. NPDC004354]